MAHYPKVFGKFDQFLSLSCIDQAHCNLFFIQDAVSGVLVQVDFDEIFEVFLNLRVVEVKDVDELAVILFDSFQLSQVVAVGIDAQIVQFLNDDAYMGNSIPPQRILRYFEKRDEERVDVVAIVEGLHEFLI